MVSFWNGVNCACISADNPNQATTQTISRQAPPTLAAILAPNGRQVCGSTIPLEGSESAGMDVGQQDGARTEVVELVHEPLGAHARHHRPDRDPALAMQR